MRSVNEAGRDVHVTAGDVCDSEYREAVLAGVVEGLQWGTVVAGLVVVVVYLFALAVAALLGRWA